MPDFIADNWVIILVVFLLLDMPLIFGLLYYLAQRRARAAENWIMTLGEIVTSEIQERKTSRNKRTTVAHIVYQYEVMNQTYRSDRLNFKLGRTTGFTSLLEEQIAQYPMGKRVEVYYNPDDPSDAVLDKEVRMDKTQWLIIGIGVLGSLFAVGMLFVMLALDGTSS
jgi:hypothetical protein